MTESRRIAGIYGILPADGSLETLLRVAEQALDGGIRTLQLRDKKQGFKRALERALALGSLLEHYDGARLIINDSLQLACQSGAHGVHVGRDDMQSVTAMRQECGDEMLIGVSCKGDAALARHVLTDGADYVSFGAIFPTGSKPDATPIGLPRLAKARRMFPAANICAIGGITQEALPALKLTGADCVAVIADLFAADDIRAQAAAMVQLWNNAPSA